MNSRKTAKVLAISGVAAAFVIGVSQLGQNYQGQLPKLRLVTYSAVENLAIFSAGLSLPSKLGTSHNNSQQVLSNGILTPETSVSQTADDVSSVTTTTEAEPETTTAETAETIVQSQPQTTEQTTAQESSSKLIIQNIRSDVSEDLTVYTKNSGAISEKTYSKNVGDNILNLETAGQVRNCTELKNEILVAESKKAPEFNIELSNEPQVLIMHTHTTESYEVSDKNYYDDTYYCRTLDPKQSVVAVGDRIARQIAAKGICVIHDGTVHDDPSYSYSYSRSAVTVQEILKKYPSIKVVLDIHRDGIADSDGTRIAPVATINGKKAAQIMIISGCDDGTMDMPNYLLNFRLACGLQRSIESKYQGLTRPVLFDYRYYNQDLTTGSLLIEVGSNGNTLAEALYSGDLVGDGIGDALLKYVKE